jgi:hypothetical protein
MLQTSGRIESYDLRPTYPRPKKPLEITSWDVAVHISGKGWWLFQTPAAMMRLQETGEP